MKKSLFIVALAATALTGCRKDDSFVNNTNNEQEGELIALHLGSPVSVTTRSTGAVGDLTESAANIWNGQELNVFMLETGYIVPATETYTIESTDKYQGVTESDPATTANLFWNTKVYAPTEGTSGLATYGPNYQKKYYPTVGTFDFFAYHDDDAAEKFDANVTLTVPETETDEETGKNITTGDIKVGVLIDGSQDLMVAKAALTEEQKASEKFAGKEQEERDGEMTNTYYSAYAARRGVQPNFKFEHLLSRFVFTVTPGKESAAGDTGVIINKIYIKDVKNEAQMIVASTNDIYTYDETTGKFNADAFLDWAKVSEEEGAAYKTSNMYLQQRNEEGSIEELDTVKLNWIKAVGTEGQEDYVAAHGLKEKIGESLLLPAGVEQYELVIEYSERPNLDAANNGEYAAAYAAAKKEAFDKAYAEAYAAAEEAAKTEAMAAAMAEDFNEAKQAAYDAAKLAAYNAAKAAGQVVATETVADWTWPEETSWKWMKDETTEYTIDNWTWTLEASWDEYWTWTAGENWVWKDGETPITVENWVWDGEAAWKAGFEAYQNRVYKNTVTAKLALGTGLKFEAGMQYNVNFTVYSLEEITLTMQLTGWENGGDLNFDNDSPFEPIEVTYGGVEVGGNTSPLE